MSILQDFYHGNVLPWEHFGTSDDPTFKIYSNNIGKLENELLEDLTEKEQKALSELKHLCMTRNNIELERMFLYAFRMGAFFILDLFSE